MTDRRYTMSEITQAADAPLAKARQQANVDRALDLFAQGLIDALKALPVEPEPFKIRAAIPGEHIQPVYVKINVSEFGSDPAPSIYHGNPPPRLPQPDPDGSE